MPAIDCIFRSVWDGGYCIDTEASLDTDTGLVSGIKSVEPVDDDGIEVEMLDGEYILLGDKQHAVDLDSGDNEYRVVDMQRLQESIQLDGSTPRA